MKKIRWPLVLVIVNLVAINWVAIRFLNLSYPIVGHDYGLAIPSMLDTFLHYHVNGISIQWYTPTFGGGLPAFPDPNNGQFSLFGLLPLLVNPWQSVILSVILYISLGGLVSYYFFKQVLKLHWTASILGMIFFSANGFMLERIAAGHLGYHAFPLIVILVVLLLDPAIHKGIAGLAFAFVIAMLIYGSGYFLIIVFGLAMLILLPLVYLYRPALFSWKRLLTVLAIGGGVALVISASKLAAVYAFMRFFPRQVADTYEAGILQGLFGITQQLLGTMNLAPLFWLTGVSTRSLQNYLAYTTGALYGYWELDMSMSPVALGIFVIGLYSLLRRPKQPIKSLRPNKKWIAWIALIFFTWLTIEFILAKGLIYPHLRNLPILGSLHVNPRFTTAFLFPIAFSAPILYNRWVTRWSSKKTTVTFLVLNLLTLLPLGAYFMLGNDLQYRVYDIRPALTTYKAIRAGNTLEITAIGDALDNTQALVSHTSNLQPYNPSFGYELEYFHPEIKAGSVWEVSDGYYNMTNPSGYVFPELNDTRPFERIPVSEKAKLETFVNHRQPDWKIPLYQQVLDWVSGLAFLAVSAFLAFYAGRKSIAAFRSRRHTHSPLIY